jgi:hypothetical protein
MATKWMTKRDINGKIIMYSIPWYDHDVGGDVGQSGGQESTSSSAPSPPALPTDDPSLWGWWSSDTSFDTTDTGTQILGPYTSWIDRSGNLRGLIRDSNYVRLDEGTYDISTLPSGKPTIHFDPDLPVGVGKLGSLIGSLTPPAPCSVYMLCQLHTWGSVRTIIDLGHIGNQGCLIACHTSSPNINLFGGSYGATDLSMSLDTWFIVKAIFDGATSKLELNNLGEITESIGLYSGPSLSIGRYSVDLLSYGWKGDLAAFIISSGVNDLSTQAIHKNWLAYYGGLTI